MDENNYSLIYQIANQIGLVEYAKSVPEQGVFDSLNSKVKELSKKYNLSKPEDLARVRSELEYFKAAIVKETEN